MSRLITAPQSREVVSFVRSQFDDESYKIIKSDDIIFEFENLIQKEIAKNTFCLNDKDLEFEMIPNKEEYSFIELIDTPQVILRIDEVAIRDNRGILDSPLIKLSTETYRNYKRDRTLRKPQYYDFDRTRLYIWKPYDVVGSKVFIKYCRIPGPQESCSYDQGTVLPYIYQDYLKYGTAMKIAQRYPEWNDKVEFYATEFEKYKKDYIRPSTSNNDKIDFREL